MKSAFIILNYNSSKLTEKLALKVSKMNSVTKIIVVDNCSPDNSFESLKKIESKKISVIRSEKNGGYSYGNNYGVEYCKDDDIDVLFISNPDVDVEEDVILRILDSFGTEEDYSILSCLEFDINGNLSEPALWKMNTYKDDLQNCFFLGRKFNKNNKGIKLDFSKKIQDAEMIKGSFFAIRKNDFISVGGFDDNVFLFCEERIISKKITNIGKKIGILTDVHYNHNHSASINKTYNKKSSQVKMLYTSRYYYNIKYNNIKGIKRIIMYLAFKISLFEYRILDAVSVIKYKTRSMGNAK